jgi:ribosomal protein L11 methyltransferase
VSAADYWELALPITDEASEPVTNFLWELGALGVVEEATPDGAARLRAFFPESFAPAPLERRVRDYLAELAALGIPAPAAATVAPLAGDDWAEAWRRHFRPLPVGRRLLVAPPWDAPPAPPDGRLVVLVEPGRAFGTGHHATTAGCLECLEAELEAGTPERAVDLGTGSGILAVAAVRLGVPSVLALDDDPDAVAAAEANAARNGVAGRVRCVRADVAAAEPAPAPLVLANLLTAAHRRVAARYPAWVAPAGALVLGGILDAEAASVREALGAAFIVERTRSADGWTTLHCRRAR